MVPPHRERLRLSTMNANTSRALFYELQSMSTPLQLPNGEGSSHTVFETLIRLLLNGTYDGMERFLFSSLYRHYLAFRHLTLPLITLTGPERTSFINMAIWALPLKTLIGKLSIPLTYR